MRARNYSTIKYDVLAFDSAIVREISTIVRARTVSEERGRIWNHRGRFWTIADAVDLRCRTHARPSRRPSRRNHTMCGFRPCVAGQGRRRGNVWTIAENGSQVTHRVERVKFVTTSDFVQNLVKYIVGYSHHKYVTPFPLKCLNTSQSSFAFTPFQRKMVVIT